MATFNYTALNPKGKQVKGTLNGDSDRHIRRLLKDDGLIPLSINAVTASSTSRFSLFQRKASARDMALVLRQLATLLQSGLTLDDSLKLMAEQSDSNKQHQLMLSWRGAIVEGQSLSSAMRNSPQKLPDSLIAAVAVGEETGHLDSVMKRLADEQERLMDNQQTLQGALVYPLVIITVAIAVLGFVMVYIVPRVTAIFEQQQMALPTVTRVVITTSNFFIDYWLLLAIAIASALFGFSLWLRNETNKRRWHQRLLALPVIGNWLLYSDLSDWCRGLAVLLKSGVPAVAAMKIATAAVANRALRLRLENATDQVRQGSSMYQALVQQPGLPAFMLHMVGSGEAGSELDTMLQRVADYYGKLLASSTETLLKLLNPLLLLIIAAIVAVIILGVLTPITQMNQMI